MIWSGALLCFVGSWLLMIYGLDMQMAVKGPAAEPYSLAPAGLAGSGLLLLGVVLLVRGLRARRRRLTERDAARAARRTQSEPR